MSVLVLQVDSFVSTEASVGVRHYSLHRAIVA
jgi:hypothetical protein